MKKQSKRKNKIAIITSYLEGINKLKEILKNTTFDFVICADGGDEIAKKIDLSSDIVIGDFDSSPLDYNFYNELDENINLSDSKKDLQVIKLPRDKDLTDTEAALELALNYDFEEMTIIGGLGRRFDHTMGNIALLEKYSLNFPNKKIFILDGINKVRVLTSGHYEILKTYYKYIGLIPITKEVTGITTKGLKYPLSGESLYRTSTRGLSNELVEEEGSISLKNGVLMVIETNDFL